MIGLAGLGLLAAGCHRDMWVQPRAKAQLANENFSDMRGSRDVPEGTVEFQKAETDVEFYTGYGDDGRLVSEFPINVDEALLEHGKSQFKAFCSPCHGAAGDGKGMISQRGFETQHPVASYHTDRLREIPVGHFFDVLTNGAGAMFSFSDRLNERDRWAVAAYIRVLQKAREDVPVDAEDIRMLQEAQQ